jgi:hypothetical protein
MATELFQPSTKFVLPLIKFSWLLDEIWLVLRTMFDASQIFTTKQKMRKKWKRESKRYCLLMTSATFSCFTVFFPGVSEEKKFVELADAPQLQCWTFGMSECRCFSKILTLPLDDRGNGDSIAHFWKIELFEVASSNLRRWWQSPLEMSICWDENWWII